MPNPNRADFFSTHHANQSIADFVKPPLQHIASPCATYLAVGFDLPFLGVVSTRLVLLPAAPGGGDSESRPPRPSTVRQGVWALPGDRNRAPIGYSSGHKSMLFSARKARLGTVG